ncbi:hypothetical protein E3N88_39290 [Mikania micrantha]|uniref:Uncharacterized protein n=1 Tax=Mikania micrantha TaxID=192012 RepID=A0A5N6LWC5_9ASTR|nr:hypothetical protein E3N88_39290 [Mikania micrantha]
MENLNQISTHPDPILKHEDERRRHLILPSLLLDLCYRKENNWLHIQNFEFLDLFVKRPPPLKKDVVSICLSYSSGLIIKFQKELQVSDDEHRELLSKVNVDDNLTTTLCRIEIWKWSWNKSDCISICF